MNKQNLYSIVSIIFIFLTFIGAGYIFYKSANAGYAVIPMLWALIFQRLYKNEKNKKR